jgi:hypothetical protein
MSAAVVPGYLAVARIASWYHWVSSAASAAKTTEPQPKKGREKPPVQGTHEELAMAFDKPFLQPGCHQRELSPFQLVKAEAS